MDDLTTFGVGTANYYAGWSAQEASIVLHTNWAACPAGEVITFKGVTDGEVTDALPDYTDQRTGYSFDGWYTQNGYTAGTAYGESVLDRKLGRGSRRACLRTTRLARTSTTPSSRRWMPPSSSRRTRPASMP